MTTEVKKPQIIDPEKGGGLLIEHCVDTKIKKVLIVFFHGVGDVVMFAGVFEHLKKCIPYVDFTVGLLKGLGQTEIIPGAIELDANYAEDKQILDYDLVFLSHFPLEDANDPGTTKGEIACKREYGIFPYSQYLEMKPKKIVAVHFQCTSVPGVANVSEEVAEKIWREIEDAGFQPMETHFEHCFHNPVNTRYKFIDNHCRGNTPRIGNLVSILGASECFIGGVSGNFHLALSVLGPHKVLFLKNRIPAGCFTKDPIGEIDTQNYKEGQVKEWLSKSQNARMS